MVKALQQRKGLYVSRKAIITEQIRIDNITYIWRKIPCGKKHCAKCPHGPYLYARFTKKGEAREVYIGKGKFRTLREFNEDNKKKRQEKKLLLTAGRN